MSNQLTIIETNHAVVYDAGKSGVRSISTEGALFKGGKALAALKTQGVESAIAKASNGRYGPVCDILTVAFPSIAKAYTKLFAHDPSRDKVSMRAFIKAIEAQVEPEKGWSARQKEAKIVLQVLRAYPALQDADQLAIDAARTVEA